MALTPLPATERYFAPEITKIYWLPTIAAGTHIPTRIEIGGGTDFSSEVQALNGWQQSVASIQTPDYGSRFISSIPGRTSIADSSITFYADKAGDDVRAVLTELQNGYVLIADGGDDEDLLADVFPARVASIGKVRSADAALLITVNFTITRKAAIDIALPTLT